MLDLNDIEFDDISLNNQLDIEDKQLLADKLLFAYNESKYIEINKYFLQLQDIFKQFNFNINFSKDITNINNIFAQNVNYNINFNNIKNILVIQLGEIEDNIYLIPALRELRNNFKNNNIDLICPDYCKFLFDNKYVDNIITIDTKKYLKFPELIEYCKLNLWNKQYDLSINFHWQYNSIATMLGFLSGATYRLGYNSNIQVQYCAEFIDPRESSQLALLDNFFYTHIIQNPNDIINEKERKLWILSYFNFKIINNKLELPIHKSYAINTNKRKIILGINGNIKNKCYPYYDQVIKLINEFDHNNCYILLKNNEDYIKDICLNNNIINLIDKVSDEEIISIISQADLYIGNNTDLAYIALVFNIPIILISQEAEDKNDHPGFLSSLARYIPNRNNIYIIQPEYASDNCIEIPCFGGCISEEAHCIKNITPKQIVEKYKKIF